MVSMRVHCLCVANHRSIYLFFLVSKNENSTTPVNMDTEHVYIGVIVINQRDYM